MKVLLILSFVLVHSIVHSADIALLDCDGNFYAYPKVNGESAGAVNLKQYRSIFDMMLNRYSERFKCVCPSARPEDVLTVFGLPALQIFLPGMWANYVSDNPMWKIPGCDYNFQGILMPYFRLPDTCNWRRDKRCLATYEISKSVTFDIAIKECPNSNFPFVSVACNGEGCDSVGLPCTSNSDCKGALTCNPFNYRNEPFPGNGEATNDLLQSIRFNGIGARQCDVKGLTVASNLGNYIRQTMYNTTHANFETTGIRYCSPGILSAEDIFQDLNRTTNIFKCKNISKVVNRCVATSEIIDDPKNCPLAYNCARYENDVCVEYQCDEYNLKDECVKYSCMVSEWVYDPETRDYVETCRQYWEYFDIISLDCTEPGGPLRGWNGVRPDGKNIFAWGESHPFRIPSLTPNPRTRGATVLASMTCDEKFQVIPGSTWGLGVDLFKIRQLFNFAYDQFRSRVMCESAVQKFKLDDTIFNANYFLPSFFALFTGSNEDLISTRIPVETWAAETLENTYTLFNFPRTCNLETWRTHGKCEVTYDGFRSLLGIDVVLNAAVSKCDSKEYPSVYVECVGQDCDLLRGLRSCDPGDLSTCPNAECISGMDLLTELTSGEPYDFISRSMNTETPQCPTSNLNLIMDDWKAILTTAGLNETSHICLPSYSRVSQTINAWVDTQYYEQNGRLVIPALRPWVSPPPSQ